MEGRKITISVTLLLFVSSLMLPAFECTTISFPGFMVLLMGPLGLLAADPRWLANVGFAIMLMHFFKKKSSGPIVWVSSAIFALTSIPFGALGCTGMDTPTLSLGLAEGGYLWVSAILCACVSQKFTSRTAS